MLVLLLATLAAACGRGAPAEDVVHVGVAANFAATHAELARRFEARTGLRVVGTLGSSGQLYAQVRSGAPFHVLLSADQERPRLLEEAGLALPGSRFTYAVGRLVLFGPGLDSVRAGGADLLAGGRARVALANPETAPYGAAALEALERLGAVEALAPRLVRGESVAQVEQFVRSGAAELGFVSQAQVLGEPPRAYWLLPAELHAPLRQDAVLLSAGEGHPAARAWLEFLASEEAREVIRAGGYDLPAGAPP